MDLGGCKKQNIFCRMFKRDKIVKNVFYAFDVSLKTINNELVLKLKVIGIV